MNRLDKRDCLLHAAHGKRIGVSVGPQLVVGGASLEGWLSTMAGRGGAARVGRRPRPAPTLNTRTQPGGHL